MLRYRLFAVLSLALFACGGKSKPDNTIPESKLDPAATPTEPVEPAPPPTTEPTEPAPPPPPTEPVKVTIEASQAKVKLLRPGTGARAVLRVTPAAGSKQNVTLVMDAQIEQGATGQPAQKVVMPSVRLGCAGEVTAVGGDGAITYRTALSSIKAAAVAGQSAEPAEIEQQLTALTGMVIDGALSASSQPGATVYTIDKPNQGTAMAIESLRLMLPTWAPLPTEPIGLGAQWEVSQPVVINNIATTQTTVFTLKGKAGTTATISGEVKVTGAAQKLGDVDVSDITGGGKVELVLDTGKLYPKQKRDVSTKIRLRQGTEDVTVVMSLGSAFEL